MQSPGPAESSQVLAALPTADAPPRALFIIAAYVTFTGCLGAIDIMSKVLAGNLVLNLSALGLLAGPALLRYEKRWWSLARGYFLIASVLGFLVVLIMVLRGPEPIEWSITTLTIGTVSPMWPIAYGSVFAALDAAAYFTINRPAIAALFRSAAPTEPVSAQVHLLPLWMRASFAGLIVLGVAYPILVPAIGIRLSRSLLYLEADSTVGRVNGHLSAKGLNRALVEARSGHMLTVQKRIGDDWVDVPKAKWQRDMSADTTTHLVASGSMVAFTGAYYSPGDYRVVIRYRSARIGVEFSQVGPQFRVRRAPRGARVGGGQLIST